MNNPALDEIEKKLREDPRYAGREEEIKQHLVDEYFKDKKKGKW